jgi:hypothetical protein
LNRPAQIAQQRNIRVRSREDLGTGAPMSIPLSTRVIVPDGVLLQEIAGESVILNLHTERMWAVLTTSMSIQEALEVLIEEYEVDRVTLMRDVLAFVQDLLANGLLQVASE